MKKKMLTVLVCLAGLSGCAGTTPALGLENGRLAPCPTSPNCVSSELTSKKHFIEPLQVTGTLIEVKNSLLSVLMELNASKLTSTEERYIRAEFASYLFGFVDDVELYIPAQESQEIIVELRSAARKGYSDLGVNRNRIELIRKKLNAASGE